MSGVTPMSLIQSLCQLQDVDQEWDEKATKYKSVRQRLAGPSELESKREAQRCREKELLSMRARLRNAELEYESLEEKAEGIEGELYSGRAASARELSTLQEESEYTKRRLSDLEDRVLEGMTKVDGLQEAVESGRAELKDLKERWTAEQEILHTQYRELRARLQELKARREELRGEIGRAELALYDELLDKKHGKALAPVKGRVCQICRVRVPSNKIHVIQSGDRMATCDGCGRILYPG